MKNFKPFTGIIDGYEITVGELDPICGLHDYQIKEPGSEEVIHGVYASNYMFDKQAVLNDIITSFKYGNQN